MTTTIQEWNNDKAIKIPDYILKSVAWKNNENLEIKAENGKIIIEKVEVKETKKKNIKELFENFEASEDFCEYEPIEINWGKPVGKEIWYFLK